MKKLIKKYTKEFIDFVIEVDNLTTQEIKDLEYLEYDRVRTHLEQLGIKEYDDTNNNITKLEMEKIINFNKRRKTLIRK